VKLAIVGLGKAGGSLLASAKRARVFVAGKGRRLSSMDGAWRTADVLFLAVPDDAIEGVARALAKDRFAIPPVVAHLSGARGLVAVKHANVVAASFHPLASLDGKSPIPHGTLVAVDAQTESARASLTSLARRFGCAPAHVPEEKRALYHAGAVVAGNLPVALLALGVQLLVDAGVPENLARISLARLLKSQSENAIERDLDRALTGPVARGDAKTLERHLASLDATHRDTAEIYRALSKILVDDVAAHAPASKRKLRAALR
jgi:predicted short-subunit dehydrogenase-like oxidoreductase (DUF2520 family)